MKTRLICDVFVPGLPIAQPRQKYRCLIPGTDKITRFCGGNVTAAIKFIRRNSIAQGYVEKTHAVHEWRRAVGKALGAAVTRRCDGPVIARILFVMPRPLSKTRKTRPNPREPHVVTPDKDNLEKAIYDAATDAGIWRGDQQVYDGHAVKVVAAGGEDTGAYIRLFEVLDIGDAIQPGLFDMEPQDPVQW